MRHHRFQWLIGSLLVLVTLAISGAIYFTQHRPRTVAVVKSHMIQQHYRQWQREYLSGNQVKHVRTTTKGPEQTLSEAQGYGMLITVLAAEHGIATRRTFDQLTRYYLDHRIGRHNALMAWRQQQVQHQMKDREAAATSATDGDLDIAYALLLAHERWGSIGDLDYKTLAQQLISDIEKYEINPRTQLPRVGNWATSRQSAQIIRPSDLSTAYFRKFAKYMQDGSWIKVALNSQKVLQKISDRHSTGLIPDFIRVTNQDLNLQDVRPNQVASKFDNAYGFNACRVPWRAAYDYQVSKSPLSGEVAEKLLTFFSHQKEIKDIYTLGGQAKETYSSPAFTAPLAYAAQAMGHEGLSQRYLPFLTAKQPADNYYAATLQMLMLVMSGDLA